MSPVFDLDALRTMVVGIELNSFSRAASHLAKSQSAVSMQLKKLEHQAGKPLFQRSGRGLVPTEAGEALLVYARRMVALNDEAAATLGGAVSPTAVRMGLPQDFCECVLPEVMNRFAAIRPDVHIEVRAGRNYMLREEVRAGRLDAALVFSTVGSKTDGKLLANLPLSWLASDEFAPANGGRLPLVLFDHPCLFRQAAIATLDSQDYPWRLSLTTPSLPGVWAAVRAGHGVTVRSRYRLPLGVEDVGSRLDLPHLPPIELRLVLGEELSRPAQELAAIIDDIARHNVAGAAS